MKETNIGARKYKIIGYLEMLIFKIAIFLQKIIDYFFKGRVIVFKSKIFIICISIILFLTLFDSIFL